MNRIILIGNGFDLAHGLKTSYADFIRNYWQTRLKSLFLCEFKNSDDKLSQFCLNFPAHLHGVPYYPSIKDFLQYYQCNEISFEEIKRVNTYSRDGDIKFSYLSRLFEQINKSVDTKNWVDIESEYYLCLKQILKQEKNDYTCLKQLNNDLELIARYLINYLNITQKGNVKQEMTRDCIHEAIYEPFSAQDISNEGNRKFKEFLSERMKFMATHSEEEINQFLHKYGYSYLDRHSDIDLYNDQIIKREGLPGLTDPLNYSKHIANVYENRETVPDDYLLPDDILFLNFNYTNTADLYIQKDSGFKVNHIHGELGNDKNPIIFGYGDELDEYYKEISKLNNNDYLKNIKSIRYLETDNYRKLLSFIDSAPFQIYIMGHSCGNSDRTLLNTLFEHKNCVSIKPFYYEKPDGTDNYIEIIQNISRNFNDMRLMRDRVVNKTYCRPLVPQVR